MERQMQVQKVKQRRGELHDARRKSLVTCVDLTQGEIPLTLGDLPEERASSSSVSPLLVNNDSGLIEVFSYLQTFVRVYLKSFFELI